MERLTRRDLLRLTVGSAATLTVGCGPADAADPPARNVVTLPAVAADSAPAPKLAAPVPPAGRTEHLLLEGTESETPLIATFSGKPGPTLMVLGGVHGNEPGGWLAAQEVATWTPSTGGLIVIPVCNRIAAGLFERTTEELGDLNRLFPGDPASPRLMERMAAEIIAAATQFRATLLLDLHESWAFYNGRAANGTAYLGQTVTAGVGPLNPDFTRELVRTANSRIEGERDQLVERDGAAFRRDPTPPADTTPTSTSDASAIATPRPTTVPGTPIPGANSFASGRGRSSLSIGGYVEGLTPILVEMGQEDQEIGRRTELHLIVVRAAMELLEIA